MWLFKRHSRPHKRFRRACKGTGRMPELVYTHRLPRNSNEPRCPVCKRLDIPLRKHRDTRHGWQKGSLLFHLRPRHERNKTWWERWLNLPERNGDDD